MRDFTLSITVAAPAFSRTLATGTFKHMMALTIGPKFAFTQMKKKQTKEQKNKNKFIKSTHSKLKASTVRNI
jgi:hypothetical protein